MVSYTVLIITLIVGMCWQSHAQSTVDNDDTNVQFCGLSLVLEVSKICSGKYNMDGKGTRGE